MKIPVCVLSFLLTAIVSKAQPTLTQQPTNQIVNNGGTVSFSVAAGGTGPFAYQWRLNGNNLSAPGIITTLAGTGIPGFSGEGGAANNAGLYEPFGVAMDGAGNLYIADTGTHRIRKVGTNGIITTVAGNGSSAYSGDGGAATSAELNAPEGVAVDAVGNLFIADKANHRIRKMGTNNVITTVAGNGIPSFSGDGGAATSAALCYPSTLVTDGFGNLFIADSCNSRIRKVASNGIITTVAGYWIASYSGDGGAATNAWLWGPSGVAVDAVGNLFIADRYNNRIRTVDTNGIIATVAGNGTYGFLGDGGAATKAQLSNPYGVMIDGFGNLFIADFLGSRIRKVDTIGIITTVAGDGTHGFSGDGGAATSAALYLPSSVAVDRVGNLFIADKGNHRIRKVTGGPSSQLPVLVLNNVTPSAAGDYDVVVSNSSGSVTSIVATLTVVSPLPLQFISPGLSNNQFNALLTGTIGGGYVIQVSSNLAVSSWSPIATGAIPPSGSITITDAVSTSQSQKFYRAVPSP